MGSPALPLVMDITSQWEAYEQEPVRTEKGGEGLVGFDVGECRVSRATIAIGFELFSGRLMSAVQSSMRELTLFCVRSAPIMVEYS